MLPSLLEVGVLPILWHQAQVDGSGGVVAVSMHSQIVIGLYETVANIINIRTDVFKTQ